MDPIRGAGGSPQQPPYVLRVFRVEAGQAHIVRTCSPHYSGLFTHWTRGRSVYCIGADCPSPMHRAGKIWKGYVYSELWLIKEKLWAPIVLEISEHLELDFRHLYARGQLWEIFRGANVRGKQTPVQGKLLEEHDPEKFPPGRDCLPVLRYLYHCDSLVLGEKNPLPDRVIVSYAEGNAPSCFQDGGSGQPEWDQETWEKLRARMKAKKSPSAQKAETNGKQ